MQFRVKFSRKNFGQMLKDIRRKVLGMNSAELSESIKVTRATLSSAERGNGAKLMSVLHRILKFYGDHVEVEFLITVKKIRENEN